MPPPTKPLCSVNLHVYQEHLHKLYLLQDAWECSRNEVIRRLIDQQPAPGKTVKR